MKHADLDNCMENVHDIINWNNMSTRMIILEKIDRVIFDPHCVI